MDSVKTISRSIARRRRLKRYFTKIPCVHDHIAERYVSSAGCVECTFIRYKKWYKSNLKIAREISNSSRKRWRKNNLKKARALDRKWYKENSKSVCLKNSRWRKNNSKKADIATKRWRKKNYKKYRIISRTMAIRRRSRFLKAKGAHKPSDINRIFDKQNGKCVGLECGKHINRGYHIDHKKPLSRGGSNYPRNIQLLCQRCNQSKGAKTMSEWRKWHQIMLTTVLN